MRLKPINEQVVVVFGASSGIGRESALRFAQQGAKVVASARDAEGLESLADEIRNAGGDCLTVTADAADFGQVMDVAGRAVEQYGRIDTWVQLAAVAVYATFEDTTIDEFRQVIDVDLMGYVHGAKSALPYLRRAGGGALILISSVEAIRSVPYHSAYGAAKHGVHGFVEALRLELQHADVPISVTEIMPTSINTPFFEKARTKLGVQPMGLPPHYPPSLVADAILHAATHPTREMVVGGSGHFLTMTQRVSPRLMDAYLRKTAFQMQKTDQPKSATAPNNLYKPVPGLDRVDGEFTGQAAAMSGSRLLQNRGTQMVLAGVAVGLLTMLARRARSNGNGHTPHPQDGERWPEDNRGVRDNEVVVERETLVVVSSDALPTAA